MIFDLNRHSISWLILVNIVIFLLTACGGGGSESSPSASSATQTSSSSNPVITSNSSATTSGPGSSSLNSSPSPSSSSHSSAAVTTSSATSSNVSDQKTDFDDYDPPPYEDPNDYVDLPPSAPKALRADIISADGVVLTWHASTDDVGLSRYEIRRNGAFIGTASITNRHLEDVGLKANTFYTYEVRAIDIVGNRSDYSEALIVKTSTQIVTSSSKSISSSSKPASSSPTSSPPSSSSSSMSAAISSKSSSATSKSDAMLSSSSFSSASITNSSAIQSSQASSSTNAETSASSSTTSTNTSSSNGLSSSSSSSKAGVKVVWNIPSQRENGEYLDFNEIGGYEILYRPITSSVYLKETITDANVTYFEKQGLGMDTIFQIAVFDKNGLFSRYLQLTPE